MILNDRHCDYFLYLQLKKSDEFALVCSQLGLATSFVKDCPMTLSLVGDKNPNKESTLRENIHVKVSGKHGALVKFNTIKGQFYDPKQIL